MSGPLEFMQSFTEGYKNYNYFKGYIRDMKYNPLQAVKDEQNHKSHKAAVIVTGSLPEVKRLIEEYEIPCFSSDEITSLIFLRGDVALQIMNEVYIIMIFFNAALSHSTMSPRVLLEEKAETLD